MNKELAHQHIRYQVESGPFIDTEHGAFDGGNRRKGDRRKSHTRLGVVGLCVLMLLTGALFDDDAVKVYRLVKGAPLTAT